MWWWLSSRSMTVAVRVDGGTVVEGPPIVRKFIGQPTRNLGRWMRKQGGFESRRIA
jgi:hypothetical protein